MSRHDLDPASLLAGLLFLALGVVSLLDVTGRDDAVRWLLPLAVVALGVVGLTSVLAASRAGTDRTRPGGSEQSDRASEDSFDVLADAEGSRRAEA